MRKILLTSSLLSLMLPGVSDAAENSCSALPDHKQLETALKSVVAEQNGGLNLNMWGTVVDRSGVVCAVVFTGDKVGAQWPGSRVISAQKANTANAFSLDGLALSTGNLYSGSQPGGFLFGIQQSNPVDVSVAYRGASSTFGSVKDPMVGSRIGGINVFGGGLALYNNKGEIIGGFGVSGDTSCADHNIAWRTRHALKLDYVLNGVSPDKNDQIIYDITGDKSTSGYGHPVCGGTEDSIVKELPKTSAVAAN